MSRIGESRISGAMLAKPIAPVPRLPRRGGGLALIEVTCDDRAMRLLTEDEISAALAAAPGWERAGNEITRTVKLGDFSGAMLYVGAVAYLAQSANHHPDIAISWNKVTLTLSTHSAGGLTEADFALATAISALP
jgi:4a-hydroxytetrahydrobiopterin dehydratase